MTIWEIIGFILVFGFLFCLAMWPEWWVKQIMKLDKNFRD